MFFRQDNLEDNKYKFMNLSAKTLLVGHNFGIHSIKSRLSHNNQLSPFLQDECESFCLFVLSYSFIYFICFFFYFFFIFFLFIYFFFFRGWGGGWGRGLLLFGYCFLIDIFSFRHLSFRFGKNEKKRTVLYKPVAVLH